MTDANHYPWKNHDGGAPPYGIDRKQTQVRLRNGEVRRADRVMTWRHDGEHPDQDFQVVAYRPTPPGCDCKNPGVCREPCGDIGKSEVVYEDPEVPLPDWARWMAKTAVDSIEVYAALPMEGGMTWNHLPARGQTLGAGYYIHGPWRNSLRYIVRLGDPNWYVPGNPHTDETGRLAHDNKGAPPWVEGKMVRTYFSDGSGRVSRPGSVGWDDSPAPVIAYKVVDDISDGCEDDDLAWITPDKIVSWADGVISAVHTPDLAGRVTEREAVLAQAVLRADAMLERENGDGNAR